MTSGSIPELPFVSLRNAILGHTYDLSITFADPKTARTLHKKYKKKNTPANILSFPIDSNEGEIVISLDRARDEARNREVLYHEYLTYLLIHGSLHLAGYTHGSTMDKEERRLCEKFHIKYPG